MRSHAKGPRQVRLSHAWLSVLAYPKGLVSWRLSECMHQPCPHLHSSMHLTRTSQTHIEQTPTNPPHSNHIPQIFTWRMASSSDQTSPTTTPTDPDLHLSTTPQSNPHMAAPLTMSSHTHPPPTHAQAMEELEQIWSSLSLEHSQNETVSFVRIPVHPRTAMV